MPMPDLDQIKQGEQGARDRRGRFPRAGRRIPPAGAGAVINANCLEDRATFIRQPAPVDHDEEAIENRLARRAANWTPANIHR
jgi:hypothetical protein